MQKRRILIPLLALLSSTATFAQEPVWDANKVQLRRQTLADGVYAMIPADADQLAPKGVPLATTSGIVVGSRATLVIDTMLNQKLADQVLGEVQKLSGAAPTYALNTSYHGDHSFGNFLFPKSTLIIQHQATRDYVGNNFAKDVQFMLGAFGSGRGIESAQARTGDLLIPQGGSLRLDLGGKVVEIHDFGFAQTGGDLWVWLPQEKVLFAGNPVIAEKPAIPWLLDGHLQDTLDTMIRVRSFLPEGATIVPGHGRPIPKSGLDWHIEYLTTLRDQTAKKIAAGASLEETVAGVDVPAAQVYAIYGWVHKQINVPAAYKELQTAKR